MLMVFFKGSRYEDVPDGTWTDAAGREHRFKRLRIVPPATAGRRHVVRQGERLDLLAFAYYRDAERWWRLADANAATWPDDLVREPGRALRIPASEE